MTYQVVKFNYQIKQTKKFICGRVNSLRKTAGTLVEKVRIKTGDFISKTIIGGRKI